MPDNALAMGAAGNSPPQQGQNLPPGNVGGSPQGQSAQPNAMAPQQQQSYPLPLLMEAAHKQAYIMHALGDLLKMKDIKQADVRKEVTKAVVDGIMTPVQGASNLSDSASMTDDRLRDWIRNHYQQSQKSLQGVLAMLAKQGGQQQGQAPQQPPQGQQPPMPQGGNSLANMRAMGNG